MAFTITVFKCQQQSQITEDTTQNVLYVQEINLKTGALIILIKLSDQTWYLYSGP